MYVDGIGLRAPGLAGWEAGSEVLAERTPYVASPIIVPECELLPPAERRRAVPSVKIALAVAAEASQSAGVDRSKVATIFTSSAGDNRTLHEIMQVLATPPREISPTRFHNSVHNAPSGYWHIASACREPSMSISCYDASFAAGLLEAAALIETEKQDLLLVAYDLSYPAPLDAVRPIAASFATALHLTPAPTSLSIARLDVELTRDGVSPTKMERPELETLRSGNPAARSLSLLSVLAQRAPGIVHLDYIAGNTVRVSLASLSSRHPDRDQRASETADVAR